MVKKTRAKDEGSRDLSWKLQIGLLKESVLISLMVALMAYGVKSRCM